MRKVCLVVNPLAGVGGPLGLKGSDNLPSPPPVERLVAPRRAERFAEALARQGLDAVFLTAGGLMGERYLSGRGLGYTVVYRPRGWPTSRLDTVETVRACIRRGAEVIVFVGGDGTARDVVAALRGVGREDTPILGVPAGVKMYSSVFASSPEAAARILADYLGGRAGLCEAEVMDIDEEAFRRNRLSARLYAVARTPCHPLMVGSSKQPSPQSPEEEENKRALARHVVEQMRSCVLYILGPGSTVKAIADEIGVDKTLLGVDVIHNGRLIARDVDEEELYRIVKGHVEKGGEVRIIVTPIGGQGFILGRGNQQISPRVVRLAGGRKALIVVATRSKLARLSRLRVDTGDPSLDRELSGYMRVVVDYGEEAVVPVEAYTG